jgi:small subunit ribosomal protein S9
MSEQDQTQIPGLETGLGGGGDPLAAVTEAKPTAQPELPDAQGWWWGTGRRKAAVARVRIKPGAGEVKIQVTRSKQKTVEEFFSEMRDRSDAVAPLEVTGLKGKVDVVARLSGGGYMGQAQAMRLGLARAIKKYDPSLEQALRDNGYLTRDPRKVERKKYGQRGARRRFQFSKR